VSDDETGTLEIFNATDSAKAAVEKARRREAHRLSHTAASSADLKRSVAK